MSTLRTLPTEEDDVLVSPSKFPELRLSSSLGKPHTKYSGGNIGSFRAQSSHIKERVKKDLFDAYLNGTLKKGASKS